VPPATHVEPVPVDPVPIEEESGSESPWLIGLGLVVVAGAFWLLLRRS